MKISVAVHGIDDRAVRRMRAQLSDAVLRRARFGDDARRSPDRSEGRLPATDKRKSGDER